MTDQTQPQPTDGSAEPSGTNPPVSFDKKLPDYSGVQPELNTYRPPLGVDLFGDYPRDVQFQYGAPFQPLESRLPRRHGRNDLGIGAAALDSLLRLYEKNPEFTGIGDKTDYLKELAANTTIADLQRNKPEALAALRQAIQNLGPDGKLLVETLDDSDAYRTGLRPKLITHMTDGMPEDSEPTWGDADLSAAGQKLMKSFGDENPTESDPARPDLTLLARLRDGLKKLPDSQIYGDNESSIIDTW